MRQLRLDEIPKTGDWLLLFDHKADCKWIQLSAKPMLFKRMTVGQADLFNTAVHYPIIFMRPTRKELENRVRPEPYEFNKQQKNLIDGVRKFYEGDNL